MSDLDCGDPPPPSEWDEELGLQVPRWYPSVITLSNGMLFAAGGDTDQVFEPPELFDPADPPAGWTALTQVEPPFLQIGYPLLFELPDGNVFFAGGETAHDSSATDGHVFNPGTGRNPGVLAEQMWSSVPTSAGGPGVSFASETAGGSAVMYQPGKIMKSGGGESPPNECGPELPPFATTETIDLSDVDSSYMTDVDRWTSSALGEIEPMNHRRHFHNLVLLPDGKVLAVGGNECGNSFGTTIPTPTARQTESRSRTSSASTTRSARPPKVHALAGRVSSQTMSLVPLRPTARAYAGRT